MEYRIDQTGMLDENAVETRLSGRRPCPGCDAERAVARAGIPVVVTGLKSGSMPDPYLVVRPVPTTDEHRQVLKRHPLQLLTVPPSVFTPLPMSA